MWRGRDESPGLTFPTRIVWGVPGVYSSEWPIPLKGPK